MAGEEEEAGKMKGVKCLQGCSAVKVEEPLISHMIHAEVLLLKLLSARLCF